MADTEPKRKAESGKPKSAKPKPKAAGRPKGATTKPRVATHAVKTACPKCGSTRRKKFTGSPLAVDAECTNPANGKLYARKTGRRTCCAACGQHRIEWTYENELTPGRRPAV